MIIIPIFLVTAAATEVTPDTANVTVPDALPLKAQDEEEDDKEGRWTGQFTLGASTTDGTNTDVKSADAGFDLERKLDKNRWTFGFEWHYSESDGDIDQRTTTGKGQYDHFLTEKSYWLATASAGANKESNIDLLWTAGVGYGYQFLDEAKWKLSSEVGVSYLSKDYDGSPDSEYPTGRVAYDVSYEPNERWKFSQSSQILPALGSDGDTDTGDILATFDTRIRATITGAMFAQLQWNLLYNESPAEDDDGDKLDKDDNLVTLTVGWQF